MSIQAEHFEDGVLQLTKYEDRGIRIHTYEGRPDFWISYEDLHALPFHTSGRGVPITEMVPIEARAALRAMLRDRPDLIVPIARPIDESEAQ